MLNRIHQKRIFVNMENKKPNKFTALLNAINVPLMIAIVYIGRLVIFGTSGIGESIVAVAVLALYGFSIYRNQHDVIWKGAMQREIIELKNFMSQFKLSKTMKDNYEQKTPKVRRF